jgi:hypothetical protein
MAKNKNPEEWKIMKEMEKIRNDVQRIKKKVNLRLTGKP